MLTTIETTYYLVKLYTHNHEDLFGDVTEDRHFELNGLGQIAADEWQRSAQAYTHLTLDKWAIWPNRVEGIVTLREADNTSSYSNPGDKPRLLNSFVASYKAAAAKRINLLRNTPGNPLWQRGYQERLIADNLILQRVQQALEQL
jgi:REP element-mobilizing transposase RayT